MDLLNAMENRVVRGEVVVYEIKEHLEIFEQKWMNLGNGWAT